jgi:starch-binding outer membrane protein, SusD/RagB family
MRKSIIISLLILTQFGCTNLDTELYDRVPEDEYTADPILSMTPIYAPMREFLDWSGWWFAQEITGDGVVGPTRAGDWDDGGKWRVLHQHTWDNNTEAIISMWSRFYNGVTEANRFIELMEPERGDPIIEEAVAKAIILRSYYYYLLIDNYGHVPYITGFSDAPQQPSRNFRDQIFYNILSELETYYSLVEPSISKTGVNQGMVYTLLAKLYLNHAVYTGTENPEFWKKAEEYCDMVIELSQFSLEADALGPFITNNDNSPEHIWAIPYHEDLYEGFNLHMRTLHYNSNLTFDMVAGPWNGFAAMEDHFNSYQEDDKRRDGFLVGEQYTSAGIPIIDQGAGGVPLVFNPHIPALTMGPGNTPVEIRNSGARVVKFQIARGAKANLSNNFPIFRYADVLLMKAEARIRQGLDGDQWVNQVRQRAITNAEAWTNVTLDMLLEERGREMFWEGHRRQDLIRFGKFNRAWWEKPASTADRNIFPIPQWAIDTNPNLEKDPVSID